jgi:hypothetical protein
MNNQNHSQPDTDGLLDWLAGYEKAWRAAGTGGLRTRR